MHFVQTWCSAILLSFSVFAAQSAPPVAPAPRAPKVKQATREAPTDAAKQATKQTTKPAAAKQVRPAGIWYGASDAPKKHAGALRIAAYNVENLFDPNDDPALSGQYDDINEITSPARCEALAAAIRKLDADVLCLEEVESKSALEWFRDKYLSDLGYDYIASEEVGYYRGVEQSVLSRVPIEKVTTWTAEKIDDMIAMCTPERAAKLQGEWAMPDAGAKPIQYFQRSPLMVDLRTTDGYAFAVMVVHYKAGAFDHQRELEALQTEVFVAERLKADPQLNLAILGDFNGTPNDMNVKVLRTSALGLRSGYDWRAQKDGPRELYTTHASSRSIDYLLMTPAMAEDVVPDSYFVLGTLHAPSDWDYKKAKEIPPPVGYASDHYPISIEILPTKEPDHHVLPTVVPPSSLVPVVRAPTGAPKDNTATNGVVPKPIGFENGAPTGDQYLADALKNAGWSYELPQPKSKTAKWGNFNKVSTWWPGYWVNAKTSATSATQPVESDAFKGDGLPKPAWKNGGSPKEPSWIEWLCSTGHD
ncbi:MAG: hypothetical protein EXS10_04160 [Phycisphaerales bacterium]|nr:hypothetical protein [Phycisphaerales bacterium]